LDDERTCNGAVGKTDLPGLCRWQWGGRRSTNGKLMITCEQEFGQQHPLQLFVMYPAAAITLPGLAGPLQIQICNLQQAFLAFVQ